MRLYVVAVYSQVERMIVLVLLLSALAGQTARGMHCTWFSDESLQLAIVVWVAAG